jgi:hypothetical protein
MINNGLTMIALAGIGGMIPGAIGAAAAEGNHPVLRGALVTGIANVVLTGLYIVAVNTADQERLTQGMNGLSGALHNPRFP